MIASATKSPRANVPMPNARSEIAAAPEEDGAAVAHPTGSTAAAPLANRLLPIATALVAALLVLSAAAAAVLSRGEARGLLADVDVDVDVDIDADAPSIGRAAGREYDRRPPRRTPSLASSDNRSSAFLRRRLSAAYDEEDDDDLYGGARRWSRRAVVAGGSGDLNASSAGSGWDPHIWDFPVPKWRRGGGEGRRRADNLFDDDLDEEDEGRRVRPREKSRSPRHTAGGAAAKSNAMLTAARASSPFTATGGESRREYEKMPQPGFDCYRSVDGIFQTLLDIEARHPDLAEIVDIGDSYQRVVAKRSSNARADEMGDDLLVLKLTNKNRRGGFRNKGIMFMLAGLHPREYSPPETAVALAEYLLDNYRRDADVTWILDKCEIHILPLANPDGRRFAEVDKGVLWRKNGRPTSPECPEWSTSIVQDEDGEVRVVPKHPGVDLNRNFGFRWGWNLGQKGDDPCENTYRGRKPFSEPETRAIAKYSRSIYPRDQRPPFPEDTAEEPQEDEDGKRGMFCDLHAYGKLNVFPWMAVPKTKLPNGEAFRAVANKMGSFNRHLPLGSGYRSFSYLSPGASIDYHWAVLGVPAFILEMGNELHDACENLGINVLDTNIDALIYAAKISRSPFATARGPDVIDIDLDPGRRVPRSGVALKVTATVSDYERSVVYDEEVVQTGTQNVARVQVYVDEHPYDRDEPSGTAMDPVDGAFDSHTEEVKGTVRTGGLRDGRHTLCLVGTDSDGYKGPVSCVYFRVG